MFPEPNNRGTFDLCLPWRPLERWFVLPWPYTKNAANLTGTESLTHLIDFQTMVFFNCKDSSAFSGSDCKVRRYRYLMISPKRKDVTISLLSRLQVVGILSLVLVLVYLGLCGTKSRDKTATYTKGGTCCFSMPFSVAALIRSFCSWPSTPTRVPKTNGWNLKKGGWKTILSYWDVTFQGLC